jgi:hypothetical protein
MHNSKQKLGVSHGLYDAPPTPQGTQMWAQVAVEEQGVRVRSLAHNT